MQIFLKTNSEIRRGYQFAHLAFNLPWYSENEMISKSDNIKCHKPNIMLLTANVVLSKSKK